MKNKKGASSADIAKKPYTIKAAAEHLSLSPRTIRRLIDDRVLRASRIVKGKLLIPAADVEKLVESTC